MHKKIMEEIKMESIIEKIKSFDIKKCAIFSLIVAIIYIIVEISTSEYIDIQSIISSNIFVVGLIIYFFLIFIKLKLKKGNIKVASCILIFSYIVGCVQAFMTISKFEIDELGLNEIILIFTALINIIYLLVSIIVFYLLLLKNKESVKNIFLIVSIIKVINLIFVTIEAFNYSNYFSNYLVSTMFAILIISIIPYFIRYENEKTISKYTKTGTSKLSIISLTLTIVVIFILGFFIILREFVFTPKNHFNRIVKSLSNSNVVLESNQYSEEILKNGNVQIKFKIADTLKKTFESKLPMQEIIRSDNKGSNAIITISTGNDLIGLQLHGDLEDFPYSFTYNNIKYYYDFEDNDNVIIVTKVKNRYYYTIGMQSDFAALITKEELSGLLSSSY